MSHNIVYQLGPTPSFTEEQRRELNALWLRLSSNIPRLLDEDTVAPLEALPTTGNTVTDANFALIRIKINEVLAALRHLGLKPV